MGPYPPSCCRRGRTITLQEDFLLIRGKRIHQVLAGRGEKPKVIRRFTMTFARASAPADGFLHRAWPGGLRGSESVRHIESPLSSESNTPLGARDLSEPFGECA